MQIVPVAKSFSCCLIIPAAAYLSILLDRKSTGSTGRIILSRGLMLGLFTGLYAALFGSIFELLITFITKTNDIVSAFPELHSMISSFPISEELREQIHMMLNNVYDDIKNYGFSWLYSFSVILNNLAVNSIFGSLGGLVGVQIINARINKSGRHN